MRAVYRLAVAGLRLPKASIGFVSSNCWDACGAKAFGFTTFWVNRGAAPLEDAYLFGLRLRVLAREGRASEAAALVAPLGPAAPAEPSLEDVFVDLARGYAERKKVTT